MPHITSALVSPVWLERSDLPTPPDEQTLEWLFDEGSLTHRLTVLSDGAFSIRPLFEGWQILHDDECAALDLPQQSQGWVREVYLLGHQQPWVFARSVAAKCTLLEGGFNMDALGTRSLGGLLFCDDGFTRGTLQACTYPRNGLPVADQADGLWARRSRFSRGSLSLLVAEVFLPDLWAALRARPENN